MATIGNAGVMPDLWNLPDEMLLAQDLVQQGAIHAVSYLLANGCAEQTAADMLASLRANARLICEEAIRRGKPALFDIDQTAS
nr:hypothetical protein [Zoogloeaceae bacterium]